MPGVHSESIPKAGGRGGLTVVELLLVMLIALLVAGMGLSLYRLSYRYYAQKDALLEQNQNLGTAMSTMVRNLRMAGNGLWLPEEGLSTFQIYLPAERGGWFRHSRNSNLYGARPIFGRDGTHEGFGSDRLTLFWATPEAREPVAWLDEEFQPGREADLRLKRPLEKAPAWEELISPGDILALVHNGQALILMAGQVKNSHLSLEEAYRPQAPLPLPDFQAFPPGARLYNLLNFTLVSYYVDAARRCLMAEYHLWPGSQPDQADRRPTVLAVGIEDMQIRYFLDAEQISPELGQDQVGENELDGRQGVRPRRIQAVNLTLVSKSSVRVSGRNDFRPLAVYNHRPKGGPDGHERRLMSATVILRANSMSQLPSLKISGGGIR